VTNQLDYCKIASVADPGCLSRIRLYSTRIPDPNCLHPGSRIRIKEYKYFDPKKPQKWFLSSRKYDPGCSSRIPDPDADFLPIPDPGSRGQKGTGSRIRIRNTENIYELICRKIHRFMNLLVNSSNP
jgi:hypothetical protein